MADTVTEQHVRKVVREELKRLDELGPGRRSEDMKVGELDRLANELDERGGTPTVRQFQGLDHFMDLAGVRSVREFGSEYPKAVKGRESDVTRFALIYSAPYVVRVNERPNEFADSGYSYMGNVLRFQKGRSGWYVASGTGTSNGEKMPGSAAPVDYREVIERRGVEFRGR